MGHFNNVFVTQLVVLCFLLLNKKCCSTSTESVDVHVGVVLDLNTPLGVMADLCMKMAVEDFYAAHPSYSTRLHLNLRNVHSGFDAEYTVADLVKNELVHGIIGPQTETEDAFMVGLGEKVHVPIISFTARSSTIPYPNNHYFIRTTIDDAVQAQALASICRGFEWPEIVVLYEDTAYGNQFLSHMNKALQDVDVGLAYMVAIPTLATDNHLCKVLEGLKTKQTRVFLVHMNPSLGYRLFTSAKKVGVMSEGYAWIITDSLSNFMNTMDPNYRDSMEGVLGVRPYVYRSKELQDFEQRWKRNMLSTNISTSGMELNVYGLWAYDTITALAIAVEKIGTVNSTMLYVNTAKDGTDESNVRISTFGLELLDAFSMTRTRGWTGDFTIVEGKLNQSTMEIFNVYGSGEKVIGYWTPNRGISRELSALGDETYSISTNELKHVIWPGFSVEKPKGWAIPTSNNLRVGIPWKRGFTQFVNVAIDPTSNQTNVGGFAIDIFLKSLELLPYRINHTFHYYNGTKDGHFWTYDDMLQEIPKNFDMVTGDLTIMAQRANGFDFSLPYCEAEIVQVIRNKKPFDMWSFIKPFSLDLWLGIIMACILMGVVLHILELQVDKTSEGPVNTNEEKHNNIYMSPITVLAFPERNMVENKWSFFVLVFWLFMAFVLMQSYTANLSAILTVDQLRFAFSSDHYVGCQEQSFMKKFLIEQLHINASRIRTYRTVEEYHDAMSKGSKKGGIDVIFDEVPYMKLLLQKYDSKYKMVGQTYKTGGLGFAFPIGSPLVAHFSRAILDITQSSNMTAIELKNFGPGYSPEGPFSSTVSQGTSSLTLYEFGGLFLIIVIVTVFSLFCSTTRLGRKMVSSVRHLLDKCFKVTTSTLAPCSATVGGGSTQHDAEEIPASNQNDTNVIEEQVTESILHHDIDDNDETHELVLNNETSTFHTGDRSGNNREM